MLLLTAIIVIISALAASAGQVIDGDDMFRGDGADAAEILRYRALTSAYVPFTLSSSLNRTLVYGSPAWNWYPLSTAAPDITFFYTPIQFVGNDLVAPTQAGEFIVDTRDGIAYRPLPTAMAKPSFSLFWENGVFNQNTLNVRVSRPLSQNLMFSAHSNYRYLAGTRFDHERNDIVNFYKFFYSDTSKVMNHGYNPQVDEHALGGSLLWTGEDSSKIFTSFSYGNFQNEYALNIPAISRERLNWTTMDRRVYRADAALTDKKIRSSKAGLRLSFINEDVNSIYAPDTAIMNFDVAANSLMLEADIALPKNWGFTAGTQIRGVEHDGQAAAIASRYYAGAQYDRRLLRPNHALGSLDIRTRLDLEMWDCEGLCFGGEGLDVEIESRPRNVPLKRLIAYTQMSPIWAYGAEGELEFGYLGILLGYQSFQDYRNIDWRWPQYVAPYSQPGKTLIIAPWTKRVGGLSLLSRAIITDTKPHLKASAHLSQIIRPKEMAHTFEFELGFDYWSERDPIIFAGFDGWNDPIYDVNLKVAAHIRTFRLFYKVDNLLNRKQAYVPGYFSPGLTFRWGINWLIQ